VLFRSFHLDPGGEKLPGLLSGLWPNQNAAQLDYLFERLGALPTPLHRIKVVAPTWLMPLYQQRLAPYLGTHLALKDLRVGLPDLGQTSLEAILGARDETQYVQIMLQEAQEQGDRLTPEMWRSILEETPELNGATRPAALRRLRLVERISAPGASLWGLGGPNELTIFCLGGRWMGRRDLMPVVVALLNGLVRSSPRHGPFQRLFVVDEGNYCDGDPLLWQQFTMVARLIRHVGSTLWISAQDFLQAPDDLLGLSTIFAVFQLLNPKVYDNIRSRRAGFWDWPFAEIFRLLPGWAVVTASETNYAPLREDAHKMYFRPLLCEHGGHTKAEI